MSVPNLFTAVLLAGGASRRMRKDKALLPVRSGPSGSRPLWAHQLATLEALGPAEVLVSGPRRSGFPQTLRCVRDEVPLQGPLGGVAACLAQVTTPHMLVLAVDLPFMTAEFLSRVLQACKPQTGAVPQRAFHYEPLAAVYPREASTAAKAALAAGRLRMHGFVDELVREGLVRPYLLRAEDLRLFQNWNSAGDIT